MGKIWLPGDADTYIRCDFPSRHLEMYQNLHSNPISSRTIHRHKSATMPGQLLNFTIFTKSTPHALRAISLATFVPAFIILLIAGIGLEAANPAIGIIPLFFSSAFSALLLANEKKCGCQASGLTGTPVHLVFDLALGLSLLMFTILGWLSMGSGRADRGFIVLGTYGTNFMVFNL